MFTVQCAVVIKFENIVHYCLHMYLYNVCFYILTETHTIQIYLFD